MLPAGRAGVSPAVPTHQALAVRAGLCKVAGLECLVMSHTCPGAFTFKFSDMVLLGTSVFIGRVDLSLKLEYSS